MSEKQAKKQRKSQPEGAKKHTKGQSSAGFNAVLILIVVVVLALGGYALGRSYMEKKANQPADDSTNTTQTVAQYAEANDTTAEEFLAAYGLDDNEEITADTDINTAMGAMTVAKYVEFCGKSVDELTYGLGDVADDMTWSEAQDSLPIGTWCELNGMDYGELLSGYEMTEDDLPGDTKFNDALAVLQEKAAAMQDEEASDTDTEDETDGGEASDEPEVSPEADADAE